MLFLENTGYGGPRNLLSWGVGRRAYTAKNLIKPADAIPQVAPATPSPGTAAGQPREWLTKRELLSRLNVGETFFDGLLKRGRIPRRRYSRKLVRYDPVKVEEALREFDEGVVK